MPQLTLHFNYEMKQKLFMNCKNGTQKIGSCINSEYVNNLSICLQCKSVMRTERRFQTRNQLTSGLFMRLITSVHIFDADGYKYFLSS